MKQFQENPWDTIDMRYPIGSKIHGRVRNLTDFGAFVELEEGIDGLVHVSDISWAKKIKHPKDVLKKDQEVDAIVTSIDKRNQRLSLSMKDLTPSAWEGFVATHRPGDVVRGKVSRFTNFGVFVELGEGLEGLCHISELSDERVDRAESVAQLGQEMDFKILRIEQAEQKIGLSHRAVGKDEEPVPDTKMYSSEAKGGMASLRELANLKFGAAAEEAPKEEDPEEKKKLKQAAKKAKAEEFAAKEAEAASESLAGGEAAAESDTQAEEPAAQAEEAAAEEKAPESTSAEPAAAVVEAVAADEPVEEAAASEPAAKTEETVTSDTAQVPSEDQTTDGSSGDVAKSESEEEPAAGTEAEVKAEDVAASTDEKAGEESPVAAAEEEPAEGAEKKTAEVGSRHSVGFLEVVFGEENDKS